MLLTTLIATLVAPALAAVDLATSIAAPSGVSVYATGRYTVTVRNVGSTNSGSASVTIQLPVTNTSPGVYVMGTLGAKSSTCTKTGNTLVCSLGSIRKGRSTSVYFDIALPESANPLVVVATSSVSGDSVTGNNQASSTAALDNYTVSFTGARDVSNSHCTGTALSSYFECTLFPSSISEHYATLNADNTVSIDGAPEYSGTWSRPTADSLIFNYTESGEIVAEFEGYGVSATCWEGLTTFIPDSGYVAPYRVCLE
ncbi:MAG: hypothetical protein Q8P18_06705 [Pseudomonadota bacterium]|nr:hypothetical protein [Pseudomonadota bacterium]